MSLHLYYHPLSSFCHKVLIALYEYGVPFTPHIVDYASETSAGALKALWPIGKIPVLHDEGRNRVIPETSIIIEYLEMHCESRTRLLPANGDTRLEARKWDRLFDLYLDTPIGKIVTDRLRPEESHDPHGVGEARSLLGTALAIVNATMADRTWAIGHEFSLADCAAAPALFYANFLQPFGDTCPNAAAYLERLRHRPSYAQVLREAEPYMALIPK